MAAPCHSLLARGAFGDPAGRGSEACRQIKQQAAFLGSDSPVGKPKGESRTSEWGQIFLIIGTWLKPETRHNSTNLNAIMKLRK